MKLDWFDMTAYKVKIVICVQKRTQKSVKGGGFDA
ncbi:hypothetical protein J2S06_000704 [Bacillus alveayuensis]|jgi:hypothetical protein|uniref:Uncharacterized protein n=1 Tax=Aeribacillus alveayuensis TaxID=279215 RepID=A0ABT9VKY0_9BACI|nr:hypothetical protein [Bacillus alveayuensis]